MANYEHLTLTKHISSIDRKKRIVKEGFTPFPSKGERNKEEYYAENETKLEELITSFNHTKEAYPTINPSLIFKLKINHDVNFDILKNELAKMGIHILSVANDKKGYWIVFSSDETLNEFNSRLAQYSGITEGKKYAVFNVIDSLEDIPPEEKIGNSLREQPVEQDAIGYLNMEIWKIDDARIDEFIVSLEATFENREEFEICDRLITSSFALFRIKIIGSLLNEFLRFKEVSKIDRPFINKFSPFDLQNLDINDCAVEPPEENATGILLIDSGIVAGHPLLAQAVGDQQNYQDVEDGTEDNVGHGTSVAGCCIYGDLEKCREEKVFKPSNYIFSAKVMYATNLPTGEIISTYDDRKLFEHQLKDAVDYFLTNGTYRIKVVNISLGNSDEVWHDKRTHQFPLASLIDELSLEYPNVIFVISAGNFNPNLIFDNLSEIVDNYPNYLIDNPNFKIINPATSALALSVGSIAPTPKVFVRYEDEIWVTVAPENYPSPFTRTGYSINKVIKPELVEYGGNLILHENGDNIIENVGSKLFLLSNKTTDNLFRYDKGTSYSAPKVSNTIGRISNKFNEKSGNFIKNLTLLSADYPILPSFDGTDSEKFEKLYKTLGYGMPNYERAVYSFDNRVVLMDESEIGLNKVAIYRIDLPSIFFETKGRKRFSISLTYNPITRATRGDSYIANGMDFRLFHSVSPDTVANDFSSEDIESEEELSSSELRKYEIKDLRPTFKKRKGSCNQKAIVNFLSRGMISPLTLAVISYNKWNPNDNYLQPYCISLIVEHQEEIDLYTQIRAEIQARARVRG